QATAPADGPTPTVAPTPTPTPTPATTPTPAALPRTAAPTPSPTTQAYTLRIACEPADAAAMDEMARRIDSGQPPTGTAYAVNGYVSVRLANLPSFENVAAWTREWVLRDGREVQEWRAVSLTAAELYSDWPVFADNPHPYAWNPASGLESRLCVVHAGAP
ncbi:MAG: hypothetical protein FJ318_10620, partial [SAR202 cluster bacterium]|nr:hypothetical protein [SAR202 cluster bacterium]